MTRSKRTRGKTRAGRLDRLDGVLAHWLVEQGWCERRAPTCVELGFGASSVTARSWFARVLELTPHASCVGVEVDAERVERARREGAMQGVTWQQGGFDFALRTGAGGVDLVRALNVLRQYDARDAPAAHALMGRHLTEGGVLVEGSCDGGGRHGVVHVQRRVADELRREALMCVVDPEAHFAPRMLRDWLPQDLRRGVGPEHEVFTGFLDVWMQCFEQARATSRQERFAQSVALLGERVAGIEAPAWMVDRGTLLWRPAHGVPEREDVNVRVRDESTCARDSSASSR